MDLQFEISKRLSREHQAIASLLGRLEAFLHQGGKDDPLHWQAAETRRLLSDLRGALRAEIPAHFAIEKEVLFPLFAQEHGADLTELLLADHTVILELVSLMEPLVETALRSPHGLNSTDWELFRAKGQALVTELSAHAEKEELGFVPAMDELMDAATAKTILNRYLLM